MSRLKVVQFLPKLDGGGVERGTLEIARALVNAGHESLVISGGGQLVDQLQREGSRHITWQLGKKSPTALFKIRKVRNWLRLEKPDIVHVRSRMPAWVVWLAWRQMAPESRPRLVSTLHGLHSVSRYSEIMGCGERVIAVSNTAQQYLLDHYPRIDPGKISVIYRGVDPNEFPAGYQPHSEWLAEWQQQFPQLANRFVICLPGRLTRLKGHQLLFDLIQNINARGTKAVGLIVGGIDPNRKAYANSLFREREQRGLQNDIVFTGFRSDMKNIFSISDVVLSLTTQPESFGRTALEALSMGTPLVGFQHGGVGEILSELYPAGRVQYGDSLGLQKKIELLIQGKREPIQPNTIFALETMCTNTLTLYQELAGS